MAEESAKPKRRLVKKAETVREQTEKSTKDLAQKQPGVIRLTLRYIAKPFRVVGKGIAKVGHKQPFKFIGHILWPPYFRNSWIELRQVTWPNRRESWQLTSAVIVFAALFGIMIAIVDFGLDKLFKQVLLK
ncbi:MAG TPA: preprotein translocase subunit SecE [Patescibacteria group bacterium]|nr:preprotein translocase subunit SecE [Patescibacteria group bacterium]